MKAIDLATNAGTAEKYGPYFFAVFFLGALLWTFFNAYRKSDTPPGKEKMYRFLLVASFAIGVLLVVISVAVWLRRPTIHVVHGTIRGVPTYVQFDSDDAFLRGEAKTVLGSEQPLMNVHFAAVRSSPYPEGEVLHVDFSKGGSQRASLVIGAVEKHDLKFTWEWDESTMKQVVHRVIEPVARSPWSFVRSAHAADAADSAVVASEPEELRRARPSAVRQWKPAGPALSRSAERIVEVLQSSSESVGAKIVALQRLDRFEGSTLPMLAKVVTVNGPFAATVSELRMHSDPELGAWARRIVVRMDVVTVLSKELATAAPNSEMSDRAQEITKTLESTEREKVLEAVRPLNATTVAPIERQLNEAGIQHPVATGTRSGDRFYVKATWDPKQERTVTCLAELFNNELYTTRTRAQEEALMRSRNGSRVVFAGGTWGKDWAVSIGAKIRGCGGRADYVR